MLADDSSISSADTVTSTPFDTLPSRCPLLPTLWTRLVTCLGDMYCTTRSTDPTSMPSSRVLVHTSAFSAPDLKSCSTLSRSSLGSDPWWTPTSFLSLASFSPSISALVLLLTKISVDVWPSMSELILDNRAARSGAE